MSRYGMSAVGVPADSAPEAPSVCVFPQAVWKREAGTLKVVFEVTASPAAGASGDEVFIDTDSMWRKMRSGFWGLEPNPRA